MALREATLAWLARWRDDAEGATAIEYGLIAALIAIAIIVGAQTLGTTLNTTYSDIGTNIGELTDASAL